MFTQNLINKKQTAELLDTSFMSTDLEVSTELVDPAQLIDPKDLLELKIIAQQIAGDFELEVIVGNPGQGSFFNFDPPLITLDPIHILENPVLAKFVAAHEGAHRRFSISPHELLDSLAEIEETFGQTGFHATMNTIEDCAINDGMSREVPGIAKYTTENYAQADKDGLHISTPEIAQIIQQIGREPKFAQALAEITRDWHRWRKQAGYKQAFNKLAKKALYTKNLDPSIAKALKNTRRAVADAITSMPNVGEKNYRKLKTFAKKRLDIIRKKVYPAIEALVKEDLDIEAIRQALNEQDSDQGSSFSEQLSKKAQQNINKSIDKFIREQAQQQAKNHQDLQDKLKAEQSKQTHFEQILDPNNSATDATSDPQTAERNLAASKALSENIKQKLDENLPNNSNDKSQMSEEELLEAFVDKIKQELTDSGKTPLAYDELSKSTQEELKKKFDQLPDTKKQTLREQANEVLQELEHEIVEATKAKLEENSLETVYEQKKQAKLGEEQSQFFQEQLDQLNKLQKKLENKRQTELEIFDQTYEKIASEVNLATNRLQRVLIPESSFKWRKDQQIGSKVNLNRALQAEADPRYLTKLFEQRLDPTQRTHAFEVLVDTSGSMDDEKMAVTFDGAVFLASLCENLGVEFEILEFNDYSNFQKVWTDSIKDLETRKKLAQVSTSKNAGTKDAAAINKAYDRLKDKDAHYKFIIVLTDAESSVSTELQKVLKTIEADGNTVVIHFGIGQNTTDSNGYYRHSYGNLSPNKFFEKFCELVEDIILNPEIYLQQGLK